MFSVKKFSKPGKPCEMKTFGSETPPGRGTGEVDREGRAQAPPAQSTIGLHRLYHQPGDLPSQASPQPPDGEFSAERTPVSATREAWFRERVGVRPLFGLTHTVCTYPARPRIVIVARQTCFLVTHQ